MWQRFTEVARKAIYQAQAEAQELGDNHVSTEHLLLGIVREDLSTANEVLKRFGVSPDRVRFEVEKQVPRGDARPAQDTSLTPRAKRVIDLAYDDARNLGHDHIGTEHLLLGLVREGDGLAGRVLIKLGVEHEAAYRIVMDLKGGDPLPKSPEPPPVDPWARFEEAARQAFIVAEEEALTRGQTYRSPEHLLLGLLAAPEGSAVRALVALGIDLDALRGATQARCRDAGVRSGEALLSAATQHAVKLAYKEQILRRGKETLATDLLVGLLREPDGVAARLLEEFGVTLPNLREAVVGLGA